MATKPEDTTIDELVDANEVKKMLKIGYHQALNIVKELNEELKAKNYRVVRFKVPKRVVVQRYGLLKEVKI